MKRCLTDAAIGGEEVFGFAVADLEIGVDQRLHGIDHLVGGKALADDLADRRVLVAGAAQRQLIELLALLLDAEDADMADMVMAAGVDAAGDLDLELADLALPRRVGEALGDALGDRNRAGIGERAVIEPRAGDDVGDQTRIGGGEPGGDKRLMDAGRSSSATCGRIRFCSWLTRISPAL